jgi:hypothetical protein
MWRRCLCILQSGILEHNTHGEDVNTYIVHSLLEEGYLSVCHKSAEWKHQHWRSPRQQVPTHKCMEQVAPPFNFLSKQWDSAVDHMRWAGYGWRRVTLIYASSVSHLLHRWCLLICHSVMLPPWTINRTIHITGWEDHEHFRIIRLIPSKVKSFTVKCMSFPLGRDYVLHPKFLRENHTFKHIHLIQEIMSYGPMYYLQTSPIMCP